MEQIFGTDNFNGITELKSGPSVKPSRSSQHFLNNNMRVFCKNYFPPKLWDENLITLKVKICHWKYGKKEKEFGISHVKLNNSLQYGSENVDLWGK